MQQEKINILIIEDEGIVALGLENVLNTKGYEVAGMADNGQEALEVMNQKAIDLALVDIEIKGAWDGVETVRKLTEKRDIPFIYLTAYSDEETLQRAMDTTPSAYLIKPYRPKNLIIAIDLALHNFDLRKTAPEKRLEIKPSQPSSFQEKKEDVLAFNHCIFIKQNYQYLKIALDKVQYIEASGNYIQIVTSDKKYAARYPLQALLDKLNVKFLVRVHRSFAVNLQKMTSFTATSVFIHKMELPVGRSYKEHFFHHLQFL